MIGLSQSGDEGGKRTRTLTKLYRTNSDVLDLVVTTSTLPHPHLRQFHSKPGHDPRVYSTSSATLQTVTLLQFKLARTQYFTDSTTEWIHVFIQPVVFKETSEPRDMRSASLEGVAFRIQCLRDKQCRIRRNGYTVGIIESGSKTKHTFRRRNGIKRRVSKGGRRF